jgi:prepilin peptidase CpaA
MSLSPPLAVATVLFLAACCVVDVRRREIPNRLSMTAALVGIAANWWLGGAVGAIGGLLGLTIAVVVLVPPFALGGIGGGDVKMMGAVGALIGPRLVLSALVLGMIAGGVLAILEVARRGVLGTTLRRLGGMVRGAFADRSLTPLRVSHGASGAVTLPYSVPLALGTLASLSLPG